jgi:hypothetical protein
MKRQAEKQISKDNDDIEEEVRISPTSPVTTNSRVPEQDNSDQGFKKADDSVLAKRVCVFLIL